MFEVTMEGPGKNSLGTSMLEFLLARLDEAAGRPILITGSGDAFSAGLDLKEVAGLDLARGEVFLRLLEKALSALYQYPAPTVALVNGHAIAGGCVITLCCDYRVASDNARIKIGLNEVALGIRFPPRILAIVRDRIPRQHREEILLGASLFDPARALALGLIDEVSADAPAVARARLAAFAANSPDAYAATKRALRGAVQTDLASDAALDVWMRESLPVWTSQAFKARIAALLAPKKS